MSQRKSRLGEYARKRIERIDRADALVSLAEKVLSSHGMRSAPDSSRAVAEQFRTSARQYGRAGLGLMARDAYKKASRHFSLANMMRDAEDCQTLASAVDIIWAGEGL